MTEWEEALYQRSALLLGSSAMQRLHAQKVIIFGIGGVGSWCAESLLRSGIRSLTLVDSDCICASNCNRQLMATSRTIGMPKVKALRERLLLVNPEAEIHILYTSYCHETCQEFDLENYDYVIDAIDSLAEKALLIRQVTALRKTHGHPKLLSSMGAALRIDPTRISVDEFWKIQGDPLARALRNKFKKEKHYPSSKFLCVYSQEPPRKNMGFPVPEIPHSPVETPLQSLIPQEEKASGSPKADPDSGKTVRKPYDWHDHKVHANGSLCPITGIFGMTLAGLLLRSVCSED